MKKAIISFFTITALATNFNYIVNAQYTAKTSNKVSIREDAGIIYPVIRVLDKNAEVDIIDKQLSWYKVNSKGTVGFVNEKFLSIKNESILNKYNKILGNYEKISEYTTKFGTKDTNRNHNIELSAYKNNVILKSGQTFSFNKNTGNSNLKSSGWREAGVIINKKFSIGVGGGICQTSSTISSAIMKLSNISFIEKNEHSLPVGYVPRNQEAMVDYPAKDLRFKNNNNFDIYISTDINHSIGQLTVAIYKINKEKPKIPEKTPEPIIEKQPEITEVSLDKVYSDKINELANSADLLIKEANISTENIIESISSVVGTIDDIDKNGSKDLLITAKLNAKKEHDDIVLDKIYNIILIYSYSENNLKLVAKYLDEDESMNKFEIKLFTKKQTSEKEYFLLNHDNINNSSSVHKIEKNFNFLVFEDIENFYNYYEENN